MISNDYLAGFLDGCGRIYWLPSRSGYVLTVRHPAASIVKEIAGRFVENDDWRIDRDKRWQTYDQAVIRQVVELWSCGTERLDIGSLAAKMEESNQEV